MSDASRGSSSEGWPGARAVAPKPDALQVGNHSVHCGVGTAGELGFPARECQSVRIPVFRSTPSSSAATAKRGMMSRLWVLFITSGLALRSDWEELEDARGRRLKGEKKI